MTRVHHLNCGTLCPAASRLVGGPGGFIERGRLVCHCLLVETDADGLVLVDTGFGTEDCADPSRFLSAFHLVAAPKLDRSETALAQIERLGFSADDVRHVVVTHLDVDHAGGLGDFPKAVVHLHAAEHEGALQTPTRHERMRYVQAQWAHGPRWQTYADAGDELFGLEAVRRLEGISADIALVPLIGHSRGHSGVAVRDEQGWLLLAGDAYFHHDEMLELPRCPIGLRLFQRLVAFDEKLRLENQARLRSLALREMDGMRLFSSHDPAELSRFGVSGARQNA